VTVGCTQIEDRGRPLDRVGAVLHGLAGFSGGRFDRIAIGDGGVERVGKSIAAWSVIANCIAMTAETPCWTSVWAVPAYGSVRPVRGPLAGIEHIEAQCAVIRQQLCQRRAPSPPGRVHADPRAPAPRHPRFRLRGRGPRSGRCDSPAGATAAAARLRCPLGQAVDHQPAGVDQAGDRSA